VDQDFYLDMQATSLETLDEFGAPATLTKATKKTYDASQGRLSSTPATFSVLAVVYPWKKSYYNNETGSTTLISILSAIVACEDISLDIAQGDKLSLGSQSYTFEEVSPIAPGLINIVFLGTVTK
jgi:hypothetical protein